MMIPKSELPLFMRQFKTASIVCRRLHNTDTKHRRAAINRCNDLISRWGQYLWRSQPQTYSDVQRAAAIAHSEQGQTLAYIVATMQVLGLHHNQHRVLDQALKPTVEALRPLVTELRVKCAAPGTPIS